MKGKLLRFNEVWNTNFNTPNPTYDVVFEVPFLHFWKREVYRTAQVNPFIDLKTLLGETVELCKTKPARGKYDRNL